MPIIAFTNKDKLKLLSNVVMTRICTKCKVEIPDSEQLELQAEKYPTSNKCWEAWKEMRIMVMNELHLDMSMADHRKVLRKHEKMFVGIMTP